MTARRGNLLGFLACVCLLAYAYYAQFVMHLEPCPLCIFQRIGVFVLGVIFLIAALHDPAAFGRRVYALLLTLAALATIGVAAAPPVYSKPAAGQRAGLRRIARFHAQGVFFERGAGQGAHRIR